MDEQSSEERRRLLWLGVKRALGMLIAAIDEYFGIETPRRTSRRDN